MTAVLAISFELARPWWLLVLALAPVFVFLTWRSRRGVSHASDSVALTARIVLLVALALALSVPRARLEANVRSVAYVLDVSESIPPDAVAEAREFVSRSAALRADDDDAAFVVFADGAAMEAPFARISSAQRLESVPIDPANVTSVIPRGETDIEEGLRLARAGFPPGGARRIVLLTDGNETRGGAADVVAELVAGGVGVQVYPLRYEREREVYVEKLVAPASSPRSQPVPVRLVVNSTHDGVPAEVRFLVDGQEVAAQSEELSEGRNVFELSYAFDEPGYHRLEAVVEPRVDGDRRNNRGVAATQVPGPGRVLVATSEEPAHLADALVDELRVPVDVTGPDGLFSDAAAYAPYDVVVIENIPAYLLSEVQRDVLAAAVRDIGVGLVCVGGQRAYGPGGYAGTALEDILPLSSQIRQKRVLPSGALVVILHTCEFPGGNEAARTITLAAIDALDGRDEIGVIQYGFPGGDEWLIPLQPVGDKSRHRATLDRANLGDMPSFDSSMKMAWAGLQESTAATKHVIVISDGDATPPDLKLVARMRTEAKITLSTVCVDPHSPEMGPAVMRNLSAEGGGNHYDVSSQDLERLPHIFIKEAVTVRRSAYRDEPFQPSVLGTHTLLTGFAEESFPPLYGYTVTSLKEKTEALLGAPHEDPLMAVWRHGLGEVAAFASDARAVWAQEWLAWGGFGRFWGQVVRGCARSLERPGVHVATDIEGGTAKVVMDVLGPDGSFVDGLSVTGTGIAPNGESQPFRMSQTGRGRYEGTFPAARVGTYVASLLYESADAPPAQALAAVSVSYSAEYLAQRSNERLFALMEASGAEIIDPDPKPDEDGTVADPAAAPWAGAFVTAAEPIELWPWIAALAALLLVVDVALRRLRVRWPQWRPRLPWRGGPRTPTRVAPAAGPRTAVSGRFLPGAPTKARAKKTDDAPDEEPAAPPPTKHGGLLDAKRRAQRKQRWEENP